MNKIDMKTLEFSDRFATESILYNDPNSKTIIDCDFG